MGHGHGVRGRSLTLGIRYHGHRRRGNVGGSMDAIGHGKANPWRWTRKVLSMCRLYRGIDYEGRILGMDREGKVQDNGR